MLYPKNLEDKIGFDSVRELVKSHCSSTLGTAYVDKMNFSDDFSLISKLLAQTEEFRKILVQEESFPSAHYIDVNAHLDKAKIPGTFLTEEEFHELQLSLDTIFRCLKFFKEDEEDAYPELKKLGDFISLDPNLLKSIGRIIDEKGHMRNNASKDLQDIRRMLQSEQVRLRKVLDQILRQARQQGFTPEDASLTVRGGRMVIPVLAEYKRRIKGFIHDESATGQTVYLEPAEVLEINNEIRDLEYRERREIVRILISLTDEVRPHIRALKSAYNFLGMIDFIRAKARFGLRFDASCPSLEKKSLLEWHMARHPLLQMSLEQQGRKIVPLTVKLDDEQRILIISGPNAGGKSVCLKTVALLQYMLQCGMLVPMADHSRAGIFKNIFIDIGDEQSLENDLSTYSSHLTNMDYFLKFTDRRSLILIDEFGTGTEPQFGGAIAEAILEQLNALQTFGIITTHYTNLKQFANEAPGVVNGAMRFDAEKLEPLFQLEIGKPGSSFALEIAQKIGLPQQVLERAKEHIGVEKVEFDKMLSELETEKNKFQSLNQDLNAKEKRLTTLSKEYEELKAYIDGQRKQLINEAKREAQTLLRDTNQRIEATIRSIKENKAEKEATRTARKELEELKTQLQPVKVAPTRTETLEREEGEIREGDAIRVKDNGALGEVIQIKGKQAEILIGSLKSNIKLKRLEKVSRKSLKKVLPETKSYSAASMDLNKKLVDFSTNLDIRGKRAEEALPTLENFVDDASMFGMQELRIIHGKGNGILREIVRDYLHRHERVAQVQDEHVERGGAGVTIVRLR
ncbi:endonuclease MutS2 [Catalinimonas niigatensis]|uniref:endonuclease MutS2 n=1 Tax=Catalinimonas niigatensis TaxID=1397264 RepID=UPI0038994CE9